MSDYENQQRQESIKRFSKKYQELCKRIDQSKLQDSIDKANRKLDSYIYKEKQALKEGCKVLDSKRNGSGFFFREVGFQEREENERKDAQSQAEKLFKEYEDSISQILKEFSEKKE